MLFYIAAGIAILVLTILTSTTKDIRWYRASLLLLSFSIGFMFYHFSLSDEIAIPQEVIGEELPSWVIYVWPVILFLVSFGIGWATRPK